MRILITGAAGFLGRKLATDLARRPMLMDADGGQRQVSELILVDQVEVPELPELGPDAPQFTRVTGDLDKAAEILSQPDPGIDGVVHLAAMVSAGAEADFELGYRVNLDGTRGLLEACRGQSRPPRFLFASSVAVFGGRMPDVIRDDTAATPQTSYGTQKLMGELLVADYSRKGMVDGRSLRLPTIVVRPGKPNKAASTFASSIVREPLQGQPATCPVSTDAALWVLSPRAVTAAFRHAWELTADRLPAGRAINLPGLTVSVTDMVDAVRRFGGDEAASLIRFAPDPAIEAIVRSWPTRFAPERALALGFRPDADLDAIMQGFVEDDLVRPGSVGGSADL